MNHTCIKTEKGYFEGWGRVSYTDTNGKRRFSGREPRFSGSISFAFSSTQTIGDTVEYVAKNLATRGYEPEIIPVFWANGRWQIRQNETEVAKAAGRE